MPQADTETMQHHLDEIARNRAPRRMRSCCSTSNRIFDGYEAIVDAACHAWNSLIADPARITSIGTRQWAIINPPVKAVGISRL